ncbi:MAG TPA: hypothetical protein QF901_09520 [Gammaproteobacteria bacterium]|nr:hypothetical protein [Gammaproteobacteria bacterium]
MERRQGFGAATGGAKKLAVNAAAIGASAEIPARWGVCFLATVTIPLILLFTHPVAPQNGWWWDILMGVGMLGVGLMIAVPLISPRVWVHFSGDPRALRFVLYVHRDVSYVVLLLTAIHVVGLLLIDAVLIEYLKLSAPWSMLAAIVAAVMLLVLVLSSLYRIDFHLRYRSWRLWHGGFSGLTMALVAFHVVDAGFYINSPIKKAVFVVLAAGPSLATIGAGSWHALARATVHGETSPGTVPALRIPTGRAFSARLVGILTFLWLASILIFAIPTAGSRAEEQANPCPESVCD